jgi:hypothetical protein
MKQQVRIPILPYVLAVALILVAIFLDQWAVQLREITATSLSVPNALASLALLRLAFALLAIPVIFAALRNNLTKTGAIAFLITGLALALSPLWIYLPIEVSTMLASGKYISFSGAVLVAAGLGRLILNAHYRNQAV